MGKVYSRNLAQRLISVAKFARGISSGDANADSLTICLPGFPETSQGGGASLIKKVQWGKPAGWARSFLKEREQLDAPKKDRAILREACLGKTVQGGQNESGLLVSLESRILPAKPRKRDRFI